MKIKPGDLVPDFTVNDQNGNQIKLSDYRGKKVILYFYPKDNTEGCTAQACNLRDNFDQLKNDGYVVLGISTDSIRKHQNFIRKYDLPFPLLSDPDTAVHEIFGTWAEKQMFGKKYMGTVRTTFLINANGILVDVVNKVNTISHYEQIMGTGF
jgi:peroxiredoxin Q/BCP